MSSPARIYLDNAATSWPKPEEVYQAVDHYQRQIGAAAGRGSTAAALAADEIVRRARRLVAQLIGAADPDRVIFTFNGTDALNLAIHGSLAVGGHVVTTVAEHNSVLRPLAELEAAGRVAVSRVGVDRHGIVDPRAIAAAMRPDTSLVALVHASNVTGAIQPAADVARIARERGALFLLDAAQTLGELPLAVADLGVDLLAAPGHKGLLGPLGTGVLYIRPGVEERVAPLRQGGTGSHSESDRQPRHLPDRYESGNLNLPGLAGLAAGVQWLLDRTIDVVRRQAVELSASLVAGLSSIDGVHVYGPPDAQRRVGIVSITIDGYDPQELAATLDAAFGVQARAGLHCAAAMHRALGTIDGGGTVRFSLGPLNTASDVDRAVAAVRSIAAERIAI